MGGYWRQTRWNAAGGRPSAGAQGKCWHALSAGLCSGAFIEWRRGQRAGLLVAILLLLQLLLLLALDLVDVAANLGRSKSHDAGVGAHDRDFDVLGAGLDHLEQGLDSELDAVLLGGGRGVLGVVLLEELAHGLGVAADGLRGPSGVDAAGLGLVEARTRVAGVEAGDERGHAERAHAAGLRVALLHAGDVARHVLDGDGVLERQAVRLRLDARLLDQDARVRVEACERQDQVVVDARDLGRRDARVLQLERRAPLAAQHDAVLALDAHRAGPALDGLQRVLHLEDVAVGPAAVSSCACAARRPARAVLPQHTKRWKVLCRSRSW